jgi:hypothetical protein
MPTRHRLSERTRHAEKLAAAGGEADHAQGEVAPRDDLFKSTAVATCSEQRANDRAGDTWCVMSASIANREYELRLNSGRLLPPRLSRASWLRHRRCAIEQSDKSVDIGISRRWLGRQVLVPLLQKCLQIRQGRQPFDR